MADNVTVNGVSVAGDEIGGVLYQRVKPQVGVDGAAADVSAANPMPAVATLTGTGSVGDGRKIVTTAATRVQLATATDIVAVWVTAETDNTGVIVVGGNTVVAALATRRGTPLDAGASMKLSAFDDGVDDLALIWLDSTVSGDGVTFTYSARA